MIPSSAGVLQASSYWTKNPPRSNETCTLAINKKRMVWKFGNSFIKYRNCRYRCEISQAAAQLAIENPRIFLVDPVRPRPRVRPASRHRQDQGLLPPATGDFMPCAFFGCIFLWPALGRIRKSVLRRELRARTHTHPQFWESLDHSSLENKFLERRKKLATRDGSFGTMFTLPIPTINHLRINHLS